MIIVKNEHIGALVSLCHKPHVHSYIYIGDCVVIGPRQVASTPHPHVSISMAAPLGPRPEGRELLEEDDMGGGRKMQSVSSSMCCLRFNFFGVSFPTL